MKVCIITTVHPVFSTRIFHREAKTLARAGYDVTLVAQHDKNEIVDGVKIVALPKPRNRFSRIFDLTWRAFRLALRQRADIYHFHDPEFLPWGWLLHRTTGKPVVYDVHEYYPENVLMKEWLPSLLRRPTSRLVNWLEKQVSRRLAGVVVVNEDMGRRFGGYGCNVRVLPNYPTRELFEDLPRSAELEGRYKGYCVLIYIGGLSASRGVSRCITMLARLHPEVPHVKLLLIGKFMTEGYRQEVLHLIERLSLSGVVEILGPFPHEVVREYLAVADIGLFLPQPVSGGYNRGESIKFFEYSAAGLPVVISDLPAKRRLVELIGNGILVDPLDDNQIASAVAQLVSDPALRRKMGERGRQAFLNEYNWEAVAQRLIDLYNEITEGS